MFESEDLDIMVEQMDEFFDNLPLEAQFSFIWKKGAINPGGSVFTTVADYISGVKLPMSSQVTANSPMGELVVEEQVTIAIQKKWGESILVDGVTYVGGIQINDLLTTQEGLAYKVIAKAPLGMGAAYQLTLGLEKGWSDGWIEAQFPG
jgi:hypothetical protein